MCMSSNAYIYENANYNERVKCLLGILFTVCAINLEIKPKLILYMVVSSLCNA